MIALLQKTIQLNKKILERMKGGRAPSISAVLPEIEQSLQGRRFGSPFTRIRPAIPNYLIGGEDGQDIRRTFLEMKDDLDLLYEAVVKLASRTIDTYEVFGVRRDRLALRLSQLRLEVSTLLAQQHAAGRTTIVDSFNTLEFVDPANTTAVIDLDEGSASLPPSTTASVGYDGRRVKLVRLTLPPGARENGAPFQEVFTPYRLDAWYTTVTVGQEVVARVNVTGADYERGATEEVEVNAIRIEPTSPMHVEISWSPDGFNYHPLQPEATRLIRDQSTFYFQPVRVGYLQFRFRAGEEPQTATQGRTVALGVKRLQLYRRGFSSSATLRSKEFRFNEPIHTAVMELEAATPYGTRIVPYLSQSPDGPWLPAGGVVRFQSTARQEVPINSATQEATGTLASPWIFTINPSLQPLPGTGELLAGRNQVEITAFPFDWSQLNDTYHILEKTDWQRPLKEVRVGFFEPVTDAATDLTSTSFSVNKTPVAVDTRGIDTGVSSFLILAIFEGSGAGILQPGYNYRLRAFAWCPAPTTLEDQRIGVVNNGGAEGTKIAPLSVYVNGTRVFQQDKATVSSAGLSGAAYRATIPLLQGFNEIELFVQIPASIRAGQNGVAPFNVYLYFQPNLFSSNLERDLGIQYVQAREEVWRRYSEFDLRYNVPLGKREAWAWKTQQNPETDIPQVVAAMFNHDPTNSRTAATLHPSYRTIDGVNAGSVANLILSYPTELQDQDYRRLYTRFDFVQDQSASAPPVLFGYRVIGNGVG